ncbi:MAG: hypothetical protein ACOC6A_02285 [Chloroflexota bacterium]
MPDRRLFGTSGVRGIVGSELTLELCRGLGKALGSTLPEQSTACVATDTRESRDRVKEALVSGLLSTGVDVVDLGILPTPALALFTSRMGFAAGAMITASHNPPEYNGVKLFDPRPIGYGRDQEVRVEEIYFGGRFRQGSGKLLSRRTTFADYFSCVENRLPLSKLNRRLKVVVDPGHGAASGFATALLRHLGVEVLPLHDEPDGSFPGRSPEPTPETLEGTLGFLRENRANLAVCFDGDADRVVFCDAEGFLGFNEMIAFVSRFAVAESDKRRVATTVESGRHLELALEGLGAEVVRGKVGDVNVAHLAQEMDAALGVENVGVYVFPELGYYPDTMAAVLQLLGHVQQPGEIRDFFRGLPTLHFHKRGVRCPDGAKREVMEQVAAYCIKPQEREELRGNSICSSLLRKESSVNTLDGLRIELADSWVLIRPSGTEPVIRVLAESSSEVRAQELVRDGSQLVAWCMEETE